MPNWLRWCFGLSIATAIIIIPFIHYRATYAHGKRFREVTAERFYRSGQLTADGLQEVIRKHGIRTVINLQNEAPDPTMRDSYYSRGLGVKESQLCQSLGAKYILLEPDLLPPERAINEPPTVIADYLRILDDPKSYPILLHCKAGLHRTGLLTAIYRMEYEGWTVGASIRELRANGFGDAACTNANEYIAQYLERYRPRSLRTAHVPQDAPND